MTDKRTYSERATAVKAAVAKRRARIREMAVAYLGGRCAICGYSKCGRGFDFHHRDPKKKSFGISTDGCTRSWSRVKLELDGCILLCANCHREVHAGVTQLPSATEG